jgi:hypothetical protein
MPIASFDHAAPALKDGGHLRTPAKETRAPQY